MNTPPRKESETGLYAPVWRKINQMIDYMREISVVNGRDVRVSRTMNGTLLLGNSIETVVQQSAGVIKQFRVKSQSYDYNVCREFDGTTEGTTDVRVAKNPNLRRTGWDGTTVAYALEAYPGAPSTSMAITYSYIAPTYRTASVVAGAAVSVEHEVIVPRYIDNVSVIFASQSENGTGVTDADWIELSPRAWARVV